MKNYFSFKTSDGLTIKGYSVSSLNKNKGVIALIHGMGEHGMRYAHVASFFASNDISTVSIDLRGHGLSDGKRGHTPCYNALMNDVDLFLENIKTMFPSLPIILYGHSMGGNLTLNYLIRKHPNVKAAIVTSPYLKLAFEPPKWKVILGVLSSGIVPTLTQSTGLDTTALSRNLEVVSAYKSDNLVHDKITSAFFVNVHFAGVFAIKNARNVSVPLLIMHGLKDRLTSAVGTEEFIKNANQNVEVKYWPELFHEIHNEPEKEEVLMFELNWLLDKLSI